MLFRRIRTHVRQHDWFAVGIDLLVVILGIYLGFQVTAWDEERRLLSQREDYMQRLIDDLNADVQEAKLVGRINRIVVGQIEQLESKLAGVDLAVSDDSVALNFTNLSSTRRIFLRRNTFDELQTSGKFGVLVSDRTLRDELVEYYSNRVVRDQFNVIAADAEFRFRERYSGVLTSRQILGGWRELFKSQVDYEFPDLDMNESEMASILESIRSKPELIATLPDLKSAKVARMREANIVRLSAEGLIGLIEASVQGD